jgi:hypothetical protein
LTSNAKIDFNSTKKKTKKNIEVMEYFKRYPNRDKKLRVTKLQSLGILLVDILKI